MPQWLQAKLRMAYRYKNLRQLRELQIEVAEYRRYQWWRERMI